MWSLPLSLLTINGHSGVGSVDFQNSPNKGALQIDLVTGIIIHRLKNAQRDEEIT
jgi:hypothetical protein